LDDCRRRVVAAARRMLGRRGLGGAGRLGFRALVEVLHVDAPAKGGAVVDDDLGRGQIADHAAVGRDLDALFGGHVADEDTADARRLDLDVGLDDARVLDEQRLRRRDLRFDAPFDDEILVAAQLALDDDRRADRRGRRRLAVLGLAVVSLGHQSTPISMLPLNFAPSAMTTRGALMSPTILPSLRTSTRSEALTLPVSMPLTARFLVVMLASTLPELSTVRSRRETILPWMRPWMTRSSSPSISPSISTVGPSTVADLSPSIVNPFGDAKKVLETGRELDVHVDLAAEAGALRHDDAGRLDVADDLRIGGDLHPIRRAGVAVHLALDRDVLHLHAGGDDRRALENEVVLLERDGPFDLPLDDEVFLAM